MSDRLEVLAIWILGLALAIWWATGDPARDIGRAYRWLRRPIERVSPDEWQKMRDYERGRDAIASIVCEIEQQR